jgi:LPS export ABC transporter protein LptC
MKRTLLVLLVIAALGGAVWYGMRGGPASPEDAGGTADPARNDFETQGVVLRQLDAEGRLQYEIEADRIVQLRDGGGIIASRLTLRHDPPGTEPGSPQRWVVTADEATLPPDGRVVTLTGSVRAHTTPAGGNVPLLLEAESLSYDMAQQQVFSDGEISFTRGGIRFRGRGLRVNIPDGVVRLESGTNGTITL